MDFVIFGVGLGATLVLLGWLWRTVGPRLRYRAANDSVLSGEAMVARISWRRFCRSGGALWVMGGFLLVLAAYVSLLLHLSDHTGATVVVATALAVLLSIILWLIAYLHRFGLIGLVPKREPVTVPAAPTTAPRPRRSLPGRRQAPAPVAADTPVQGPAVPADIASSIAAATAETPSKPVQATESTSGAEPAPAAAVEHDELKPPSEPTVIGASKHTDERPDVERASSARRAPRLVNAHHLARESASPAPTPANGNETRPERDAAVSAADVAATGHDRDTSTRETEDDAAAQPRSADTGRERNRRIPRIGSEAFRASLARQEEHLARAAGRSNTTDVSQTARHTTVTAGPAGVEGTDWVHGDGTPRVPDGFPIKGNARSRRYHPVGAPSYDSTIADFYFASPAAAEAAGYRLPKSLRETSATAANETEHHP